MTPISALGYIVPLLVGATALARISGALKHERAAAIVAWVGLGFFGFQLVATGLSPFGGRFDFTAFWDAGRIVLDGRDPIEAFAADPLPPLNPPSAFPLFAALGAMPYRTSFLVWTLLNGGFLVGTAALALRIAPGLDRTTALLFAATLLLSNAARACLTSGQLSILTAFCLYAAVRPSGVSFVERGVWLAISTIKVGTTAPFCAFFARRGGIKTLLVAAVAFVCLSSWTGSPTRLPGRMLGWWEGVQRVSRPGTANDFTYESLANDDMIALDHAFFRLGLRDRASAKAAQWTLLIVLGIALLREFNAKRIWPLDSAVAVLSIVSALFLYHRLGDMTILAVPLALAFRRTMESNGRERATWGFASAGLVVVLFLQRRLLSMLALRYAGRPGPVAEFVQAAILPHATWILLACLSLFWVDAGGRRQRAEP